MAKILPNGDLSGKLGDKVYVSGKNGPYVRAAVDKEKYKDRPLHPTTKARSKRFGHCSQLVKNLKEQLFPVLKFPNTGEWHNDLMRLFMLFSQQAEGKSLYHHLSNAKLRNAFNRQKIPFNTKLNSRLVHYDRNPTLPNNLYIIHGIRLPKHKYITGHLAVKCTFGYLNINRQLEVVISDLQQYILAIGDESPAHKAGLYQTAQPLPPCSNTTHPIKLPFVAVHYIEHPDKPMSTILGQNYAALFLLG